MKLGYLEVVEAVRACLKLLGLNYVEFYLTPLRAGYRVEVYPPPSLKDLGELASCLSKRVGVAVELGERTYGAVLIVKA